LEEIVMILSERASQNNLRTLHSIPTAQNITVKKGKELVPDFLPLGI
jgi:hypothetical protein